MRYTVQQIIAGSGDGNTELPPAAVEAREYKKAVPGVELDLQVNIVRGRHGLQTQIANGLALREGSRDNTTYRAAAFLKDRGLSEECAATLLIEQLLPTKRPGDDWSEDDIHRVTRNAYAYGQNEPGARAAPDLQKTFKHFAEQHGTDLSAQDGNKHSRVIVLQDEAAQDAARPPEMLIAGILPRIGTAMWGGAYGSGKGLIVMDLALSVTSGKPFLGHFPILCNGTAVYLTSEGLAGIQKLRRPAWRIHRGIPVSEKLPFYTYGEVPTVIGGAAGIEPFCEALRKVRPALVVIDPLASSMLGLKQNDNDDATRYDKELARPLADALECLVLTVAHTGKTGERGIRGASAFGADCDAAWIQTRPSKEEKPPRVLLTCEKAKDFEPQESFYAKGVMVHVPEAAQSCPVMDWLSPELGRAADKDAKRAVKEDPLSVAFIRDCLTAMGAVDRLHAVSCATLANHTLIADGTFTAATDITTAEAVKTRDSRAARLRERAQESGALGRIYAFKDGEHRTAAWKWCLPIPSEVVGVNDEF